MKYTKVYNDNGSYTYERTTPFVKDDGGRADAGFKGTTGDCVVRAIAIATGIDYQEIYDELYRRAKEKKIKNPSPRTGVHKKVYEPYLKELGFVWNKTMEWQSGCKVHFSKDELPQGTLIARLSRHLSVMIDGEIHDTYDPSRGGTRCVYGYWTKP